MNYKTKVIFFSPTGTTKKILLTIAEALGSVDEIIDLKQCQDRISAEFHFSADDLIVFGTPVYSGRAQADAVSILEKMNGNGAKLVAIAVYGNRAYEDALVELLDTAENAGFVPIAAGAFVGEHSFSSQEIPIAHGRPDKMDLEKAAEFGRLLKQKITINADLGITDSVPGNRPYRKKGSGNDLTPVTDHGKCIQCQICIKVCPNNAIVLKDKIFTHPDLCMMCCACIKDCPVQARSLNKQMKAVAQKLHMENPERKEPVWFL